MAGISNSLSKSVAEHDGRNMASSLTWRASGAVRHRLRSSNCHIIACTLGESLEP
jgi:hypothetical protein